MRKIAFVITAAFCMLSAAAALAKDPAQVGLEDLTGSWTTSSSEKDDDMELTATGTLTFKEDGSFTENGYCLVTFILDAETSFTCDFVYSASGTASVVDGVLTLAHNPSSATIKEGKKEMPGLIKAIVMNPLKTEMKRTLKKPAHDRIVSFDNSEMTLLCLDDKDAEKETYHRK